MVQLSLGLQVLHLSAVFSIECMNHHSEKFQHLFTANRQFEKLMMNVVMPQADIHQLQPSESHRKVMRPSICGEIRKPLRGTHHELYGAGTMNNTLCLGIFAALVYLRDLKWYYSCRGDCDHPSCSGRWESLVSVDLQVVDKCYCWLTVPFFHGLIAFLESSVVGWK
ncbi:Alpha/beta hydrolase domain-containing protein 11 [Desmophyllum pertusum]|uniref:Alpha/beta hydrolase domain-containing protein 11 n=1 Tax=Desmophyllum pertusum TaxID=174260 RepID=A0A9W9YWY4_9CNID|nr:Alpha/beta hydrolase domain-containing protein 11 [Desmophyllum pertusum]